MTRPQLEVLLSQLKPIVAKTRVTVAPTVNVNCLLLDDSYEAIRAYRDLLTMIEQPPQKPGESDD